MVADADEDEGVWGIDGQASWRREGGDEGEVSCSPWSPLSVVDEDEDEDEGKDEADEGLWLWLWLWWIVWTREGSSL